MDLDTILDVLIDKPVENPSIVKMTLLRNGKPFINILNVTMTQYRDNYIPIKMIGEYEGTASLSHQIGSIKAHGYITVKPSIGKYTTLVDDYNSHESNMCSDVTYGLVMHSKDANGVNVTVKVTDLLYSIYEDQGNDGIVLAYNGIVSK